MRKEDRQALRAYRARAERAGIYVEGRPPTPRPGHIAQHTKEELNRVAVLAKSGDEEAKRKLMDMMRPMVVSYIRRLWAGDWTKSDYDEMYQAAWVGVFEALERFDPETSKFWTYAYYFIVGSVQQWAAANAGVIPLTRQQWARARKVERAVLNETNGRMMPYELHDDDLAAIEKPVLGKATTQSIIGDIFRARQQGYDPSLADPAWDLAGPETAEDEYLEETHDADDDALDTLKAIEALLDLGWEDDAYEAAYAFVERQGLPCTIADRLLEVAHENRT